MFGYYYGFDLTYLVLVMPAILLGLWAQMRVKSTYARYSQVRAGRGITADQAARLILDMNGLRDVPIQRISGSLTDHYDPRDNTVYLSDSVYHAPTVAAVGVAAHEAGHAVQYAENYGPVRLRKAIIPATQIGSKFSFILLIIGMALYSQTLFLTGILLFSLTTIFQLVTLPVEFNASARAIETIEGQGLLEGEEIGGVKRVLRAAAMTYVAALLMSALQLLRFVLIFLGRSDNGRRGGGR